MNDITNYGTLKSAIASYLHRSDQTDNIPVFISLAHARIMRNLHDAWQVARYQQTTTAATRYLTLPSKAKKLLDVQVETSSGRQAVLPMSTTQMNTVHSTVTTGSYPSNYTLRGRTIEFQPSIPSGVTIELLTMDRLAGFSSDSDTNAILTKSPNIYVYATLLEANIFTQGDERLSKLKNAYDLEVEELNDEADELALSGGPLQIMKLGVSTP